MTSSINYPPSAPYEDWLIEQLKDPEEAAAYLNAVIEDGDPDVIAIALRQLQRARESG
jgi:DNA-binding phage protein